MKNKPEWDRISQLLADLRDNLKTAALEIANLVDADPDFIRKYCQANPTLEASFLQDLEKVGRGKIHEALLFSNKPIYSKLRRLHDMGQQAAAVKNGVLVVEQSGDKFVQVLKKIDDIKPAEAALVIVEDRILDVDEQITILKNRKVAQRYAPAASKRWEITDRGTVVIMAYTELTEADFEEIGRQLHEHNLQKLQGHMKKGQVSREGKK